MSGKIAMKKKKYLERLLDVTNIKYLFYLKQIKKHKIYDNIIFSAFYVKNRSKYTILGKYFIQKKLPTKTMVDSYLQFVKLSNFMKTYLLPFQKMIYLFFEDLG